MAPPVNQIIPLVIAVIAFIFFVAAAATCSWEKVEAGGFTYTFGLWKACSDGGVVSYDSSKPCSDYPNGVAKDTCQKKDALRAFTVMACIFAGALAIWCLLNMFRSMGSKLITVILFIVAAICGVIAMAIAADMHDKFFKDLGYKLDAGFGLVIVGWILCLFGAIFAQVKSA